jgi:hypothetical protein
MSIQFAGRIIPGQKVRDIDGNTLGTVAHIYREDVNAGQHQHDDILEVKKGPFGLGQRLYIPVSLVDEVTDSDVCLGRVSEFAPLQWRSKPDYLNRLT